MRVTLAGGAYTARSLIANAQRSLNLYPETNPQDAPVPITHYPTPGMRLLVQLPRQAEVRCLYRLSDGSGMFAVAGNAAYLIGPDWSVQTLGTLTTTSGQVSAVDNGTALVVVDGSPSGYTMDMPSRAWAPLAAAGFYGGNRVELLDTFFLVNKPGTPQFNLSDSNSTNFDPLFFANKTAFADPIVTIAAVHREVWLIGELTTEVWLNSGAADFPFQIVGGAFVEHGCAAKYSVARADTSVLWLSQNVQGDRMVLRGFGYQAKRVSTYAIEAELASYSVIADAIGFTYQQLGHTFYVLTFPTEGKTWVYDLASPEGQSMWHERCTIRTFDGSEGRWLPNCHAFFNHTNVVGDPLNGMLYALDPNVFTDNGVPIKRTRSLPHMLNDGKRLAYRQFIADMEVGTDLTGGDDPQVSLRWSDTRGKSWGDPIEGSLGKQGEFLTSIQFQRLGLGRDRVFELSWSAPVRTALNGAFLDVTSAGS